MVRFVCKIEPNVYVDKNKIKEIESYYIAVHDNHLFKNIRFRLSGNKLVSINTPQEIGKLFGEGDKLFATLLSQAMKSGKIYLFFIGITSSWGYTIEPNRIFNISIKATYQKEDGKTVEIPLPIIA